MNTTYAQTPNGEEIAISTHSAPGADGAEELRRSLSKSGELAELLACDGPEWEVDRVEYAASLAK